MCQRMLNTLAPTLGTLICAIALGGMLFSLAVFIPFAMRKLGREAGVRFVREAAGRHDTVLAILTTLAAVLLWSRPEAPVLATVALLFVFSRFALLPRLDRARVPNLLVDVQDSELSLRLNRLSVIINVTQIAALLLVLIRLISV